MKTLLSVLRALIVVAAFLSAAAPSDAESDVSLYNSDGAPVAYVDTDDDDDTIYLWNGTPVAYLYSSSGSMNVYGFDGKHLGWFDHGVVMDHDGKAACVTKGAYPGATQLEPFKAFKRFKPFKSFREFAPLKPLYSREFSDMPCAIYLRLGING